MFSPIAKGFAGNECGGVAALTALLAVPVIGAIGIGVDTYRAQNAATALDHVTNFTCHRVADADMAFYQTDASKKSLGQTFAKQASQKTSLDAARSSFEINVTSNSVRVTGRTSLDASFMGIFGFGGINKESERTCPMAPRDTTEKPGCPAGTMILTNTDQLSTTLSSMTSGQAYMASVITQDQRITRRSSFGQGQTSLKSFISGINPDDYIVMQEARADGTFPAPCSPQRPPGCVSEATCPPPPPPPKCVSTTTCPPPPPSNICPAAMPGFAGLDGAGELNGDESIPNPDLSSRVAGGVIRGTASNGANVNIPITNPFNSTAPKSKYLSDQMRFLTTLSTMADGGDGPLKKTMSTLNNGGRLYRIVSDRDSIWEVGGQCLYVISPIVLDLIARGEIVTTGATGGRMPLPMPVKNWRWFDLYGAGKPVRTEWIVGNGQGLLVDNRDGKALSDMSGKRLFGNGRGYSNGYEKLAAFDLDGDGKVSGAELEGLMVWVDDGDAAVRSHELKTLQELNVTEISVRATEVTGKLGETHLRSTAVMNGREILTEDVWFNTNIANDIVATHSAPAVQAPNGQR